MPTESKSPDGDAVLARLFELAGDLMCAFDSDGVVRWASDGGAVLGYSRRELIGSSLFERVDPDQVAHVRTRLGSMHVGGAPLRFESRCRGKDLEYRWTAWNVARVAERKYAAVLRDATERKWVEHELAASLSLVEATLESTADGLLVADTTGHIVTFNRRFLELWRMPDSVVFAGSVEIDAFCDPLLITNAAHVSIGRELAEAGDAERYEVLALVDGRVFERYSRARRIGDKAEGRVWSFRDVTERVRAERDLREHLAMGIEHAVEGIAQVDERGRYSSVNAVYAKMMGYEESELVGMELGALCHPDDRARVAAARDSLEPDGKVELEVRALKKDGSSVLLRGLLVRRKETNGFNVFLRDISEQRELQNRLLVADRMASMGTLAAGVAHEINNPLSFVMVNADVLAETLPTIAAAVGEATHDELTKIVSDIREGAERVRRIVRDLKMFSRPDDTAHGPVDVQKVLESTINMAWNEIRHRARLVRDYGPVRMVDGNDGQLGQVFLNLLVNASHAIAEGNAEGNEIRIVTTTDREGRVVVEIRDTGSGISASTLPRIFDPFFTTKPIGVGTGLGLSVCHGIIVKLGGEIKAESEVGKGTVFRVVLRAADERTETVPPPKPAMPAMERSRILVIDDEVMVGTALRRSLSRHHDVVVCSSGREALALLAVQSDFSVILCDVMMPDVSGMDVYEALVRTAPAVAQRIVFMSGGIFTPRAKAFLDDVPNHRVDKPIDVRQLLEWIRVTLTSRARAKLA